MGMERADSGCRAMTRGVLVPPMAMPQNGDRTSVMEDIGRTLVLVLMPFLVPSILRYLFDVGSFTTGVVTACGVICVLAVIGIVRAPTASSLTTSFLISALLAVVIGSHAIIVSYFNDIDLVRAIASLVPLATVILTTTVLRINLFTLPDTSVDRIVWFSFAVFVVIGVNGLGGYQPASIVGGDKTVFPFTEPSHYALAMAPFIIYLAVRSKLVARYSVILISLALALLLQNLSLLVCTLLGALIRADRILVLLSIAGAPLAANYIDLSYFTDRLDFSYGTTNLSTLVYLQGLELAEGGLRTTNFLGIGYQQLGVVNLYSPTTNLIYRLLRDDFNLFDGGFTGAKLVAELGVFGLVLVATFVMLVGFSILKLRGKRGQAAPSASTTLALASVVAFSVEMFVRGAGYFTPTTLLLLSALPIAWATCFRRSSGAKA